MTASIQLLHGDCLEVMARLRDEGATFDSVITDPPFGWSFMGRKWDSPDTVAFRADTWRLAMALLPPGGIMAAFGGAKSHHRLMCAVEDAGFEIFDVCMWLHGQGFPKGRTQLKPAYEPIILARKPTKGPVRVLNIDKCRIATPEILKGSTVRDDIRGGNYASGHRPNPGDIPDYVQHAAGRWPANILHSGEPEVLDLFASFGKKTSGKPGIMRKAEYDRAAYGAESRPPGTPMVDHGDTGTVARFYYCAKASKAERAGSKHPTIKPQSLLRWLVRLITPPGGTVLDCFAGSGSTGMAALAEGRSAVLIEREAEHIEDARRRLGWLEIA
jgi:site-specific DNA-methyltransferase (adenine-specific)